MLRHQLAVPPFDPHPHRFRDRPERHGLTSEQIVPQVRLIVLLHEPEGSLHLVGDVEVGEERDDFGEIGGETGTLDLCQDPVLSTTFCVLANDQRHGRDPLQSKGQGPFRLMSSQSHCTFLIVLLREHHQFFLWNFVDYVGLTLLRTLYLDIIKFNMSVNCLKTRV